MSVGGSILTTAGLNAFANSGSSIIPKYFKFSSDDIVLEETLTDENFTNPWIQKDITLYQVLDNNTIEFVCDLLPTEATNFTRSAGLYLEDGTLFMAATPPNAFPSGLRQTFRIQMSYTNAGQMLDFQYIDLDNTNVKFVEIDANIAALEASTTTRMDSMDDNYTILTSDNTTRINALEAADIENDTRVGTIESNLSTFQTNTNASILSIQTIRTQDLEDLANSQAAQDILIAGNTTTINTLSTKQEQDNIDTNARIDNVILNSDVGNLITQVQSNTEAISVGDTALQTNISNLDTQVNADLTSLTATVNTNKSISDSADSALNTRMTTLENNLNSMDTEALQTQLNNLETTVGNNHASTNTVTNSLDTRITSLENQDIETLEGKVTNLETNATSNFNTITSNITTLENTVTSNQSTQDTRLSNLESWRVDTYITDQTTQDTALANSISAQTTINNGFSSDINIIKQQLSSVPPAEELEAIVTQVEDLITTGNEVAIYADSLYTARTINLTGDVTGSVSFDGSQDVSLATTVQVEALPAGGTIGQALINTAPGTGTWQDINLDYLPLTGGTLTGDLKGTNVEVSGDLKMTGDNSYIWTPGTGTSSTGIYDSANSSFPLKYLESGRVLELQKLSGVTVFGDTTRNSDNIVRMKVNSGYKNLLELTSAAQGSAQIYIGQENKHGVSFLYNADDTPDEIGTADVFSVIRRTSGVDYQQFYWHINSPDVTFTGDVIANSDIRVKDNIETIENALDKISVINGVTYNRTDLGEDQKNIRMTGVIAQEVQAVLPEAVKSDEDGKLSVAYGNLVGLLIEGIKELQEEIRILKTNQIKDN
jgi:predicted  nucleic acid-binding Zn-ribbon protein